MASLKKERARADGKRKDSNNVVTEACQESKQRMVHWNVTLSGQSCAEKLMRFLLTRPVSTDDAVAQ